MVPMALLQRLADGEFHSGSALGEVLGVSRTAVWKSLSKLDGLGLVVESVKGKGYRLSQPLDLLDEQAMVRELPVSVRQQMALRVLPRVDSTNSCVAQWLAEASTLPAPYRVVLAEQQTAGRGRHGRTWCSPFARNLYLSLGFELTGGVEVLSGLSLVVGLALIRSLKALGCPDPELKWPNDVWLQQRKLAGVLVELQGEATTAWRVVVGIGLNVAMSEQEGRSIGQPWISLNRHLQIGRNTLAARVLQDLHEVLVRYRDAGFSAFMDEWNESDLLRGRAVCVDGGRLSGVAQGIDGSGALLLRLDDGSLRTLNAGEVSVRPDGA
jgi:BirA family biotin operon repressor/biotin-[acetyl-CoA-carboxylase] ligase